MDELITLMIIVEESHINKTNLPCFFRDFRKKIDTMPRNNLLKILEEVKFPFELRDIVIRLYEKVICKFRNIEG